MKRLPIGVSTFERIVTSDALYVDKTEVIYELIRGQEPKRYFFSRPRRFGKSLTCSTLNSIFSGRKEHFQDLWIGKSDYDWKEHPVIYFDFSQISHQTPEALVQGLHDVLNFYADRYKIELKRQGIADRLAELVLKIGESHGPVVIIIDEYDKPLVDLVDNLTLAELSRNELKAFYGALKGSNVDTYMQFLFVTGVSKFSKMALFSDLNNLDDLTNDARAAALVGYTDDEVDRYLHEHIQAFAAVRNEHCDQTRQTLKAWYNGYRFSNSSIKVYNPFSLHNCLTKQTLSNYWFTSGTPNFLMKFIKKNPLIASDIETIEGSFFAASSLESFTLDLYYQKYRTLLLQTGYLTFASDYDADRNGYFVSYPNREVRYSMTEQIMEFVFQITPEQFGEFGARFTKALSCDDLESFRKHLQDFIKLIPCDLRIGQEKYYQQIFFMIGILFGKRQITAEVSTEEGYVDIYMEGNKYTFVNECKFNKTVDIALQQIKAKRYYEKFKIFEAKKVMLAGISFNTSDNQGVVVSCKTEEI